MTPWTWRNTFDSMKTFGGAPLLPPPTPFGREGGRERDERAGDFPVPESRRDTIFARASGAGRAGVAVYRISGPAARTIGELLSHRSIEPRRPTLTDVVDPASGEAIDRGLALFFPGPKSFTGEDVVEFHLHGSRAVEAAFAEATAGCGARLAEPGEFARRAFLNGKLDLAQVEALADLIDAETTQQRKQALGQFGGRLSGLAEGWRARLIAILAPLEADIDFPDEDGVPAAIAASAGPQIEALVGELEDSLRRSRGGRRLREGVSVAIIGAPNAGKSSLLNALAGSDVAIVAATPGTTRDVIETRLDLGGAPVLLADTAGLAGHTDDAVEREGMARAVRRAQEADLRILVIDPYHEGSGGNPAEPGMLAADGADLLGADDIIVWSKRDLGAGPVPAGVFSLSARTGEGMAEFLAALAMRTRDLAGGHEGAALTRLRHTQAVERALAALARARLRLADRSELAAEDVRLAARALASITGAVDVEDVLAEIFSSFCIGK